MAQPPGFLLVPGPRAMLAALVLVLTGFAPAPQTARAGTPAERTTARSATPARPAAVRAEGTLARGAVSREDDLRRKIERLESSRRRDVLDVGHSAARLPRTGSAGRAAGGEDIANAVPILALPFTDTGNTCGFADDYEETCPFDESDSPDVVYSWVASFTGGLDVRLCDSAYDTKILVYQNTWTPGSPYGCNDDGCGELGFQSELRRLPVVAGNTYYLVVDGFMGDCGDYTIEVSEAECPVSCPAGAIVEAEPECFDGWTDVTNGGCSLSPPLFSAIPCDPSGTVEVCGTYGGFVTSGADYRDTDWYEIDVPLGGREIRWSVSGEVWTLSGILSALPGCPSTFLQTSVRGPCETAVHDAFLPAGRWWLFVAPDGFGPSVGICGRQYSMTIEGLLCADAVSAEAVVEAASWGWIKGHYRGRPGAPVGNAR